MEKETALEIEITKIDDNYSYCKIMYQNKNILKFFKKISIHHFLGV